MDLRNLHDIVEHLLASMPEDTPVFVESTGNRPMRFQYYEVAVDEKTGIEIVILTDVDPTAFANNDIEEGVYEEL